MGPVVKTPPPNAGVVGSIPGQGSNMPQGMAKKKKLTTTFYKYSSDNDYFRHSLAAM